MNEGTITRLRSLIASAYSREAYRTAMFWADKVSSVTCKRQ